MSYDAASEFAALSGIAAGMLALGGSSLWLSTRSLVTQASAVFVSVGIAVSTSLTVGNETEALVAALIVLSVGSITTLIRSQWVFIRIATILRRFSNASFQGVSIVMIGGLVLIASVARFESNLDDQVDRDFADLMAMNWKPILQEDTTVNVLTDRGHPIAMRGVHASRDVTTSVTAERQVLTETRCAEHLICTATPSDRCNCHGWVFTGGRYWLTEEDVACILADNGYVSTLRPVAGDLVIYRQGNAIAHSAIVRAIMPDGSVMVEGKWAWMGVYLHLVDGSVYGHNYTYYHSPRAGHVLAGLGEPTDHPHWASTAHSRDTPSN